MAGYYLAFGNVDELDDVARLHLDMVDALLAVDLDTVDGEIAHVAARTESIVGAGPIGETEFHRLPGICVERYGNLVPAPRLGLVVGIAAVPDFGGSSEIVGGDADYEAAIVVVVERITYPCFQRAVVGHREGRRRSGGNLAAERLIGAINIKRLHIVGVDCGETLVARSGNLLCGPCDVGGRIYCPAFRAVIEILAPGGYISLCLTGNGEIRFESRALGGSSKRSVMAC